MLGAAIGAGSLVASVLITVSFGGQVARAAGFLLAICVLTGLGAVIVLRRPRNLVGWLCHAAGILASLSFLSASYVDLELAAHPRLPPEPTVGWFSLWLGSAWVWILLVIPLVFPDGRLPSRRWRPAAGVAIAVMIADCMQRAFNPTVPAWQSMPYNPLGVAGAEQFFAVLARATNAGLAVPLTLAVLAVVVRFRRSVGAERLQLKWLMYALGQLVALFTVYAVFPRAFPQPFSDIIFGLSFSFLPAAVSIAVMRHRLYEIDRIISRTIVYAVVTVVLYVVYSLSVLIAGTLLDGNERWSTWVVAGSTLAAFVAFQPIRTRVQNVVDRHFNRPRYDSHRTLATFNASLREQLDADAVASELLRTTRTAVQPSQVALWLRPTSTKADHNPEP